MPVGALGTVQGEDLMLRGVVAAPDGTQVLRDEEKGRPDSPESAGGLLGERMLRLGAAELMARRPPRAEE
jgi:hydroxymethylbilane synthase